MAKPESVLWSFLPLLLWSYRVHGTLHLQLGEKCQLEEKTSHIFPSYDDFSNGNTNSSSNAGVEDSEISSVVYCDPTIPLICLAGRCQCKKGFTINRNGTRCLEIARNGLDSACEENIQCWKSLLGRMSECNVVLGKCQCYESESLPIVYHHGRCYYGESLGEFCQIDGLCEATSPNATCRSGTCQCKEGFVPSWDKSRCIPIAIGLNSTCEENIQCEKSQLGALSECNQETMKCNCYKIPDMDTVFHGGKCYFEASLGDVCQVSAQCQKKTSSSVCSRNGKCLCDDGYISNGNNTLCLPIPSSDGAVVVATTTTVLTGPDAIGGISGGGGNNGNSNSHNNNNNGNGECLDDSQCYRLLGPYSRCNAIKRKCECFISENLHFRMTTYHHNTDMHTNTATDNSVVSTKQEPEQVDWLEFTPSLIMIGSKCYPSRYLGQLCKFNKQCSAVTENSWCDNGRCDCLGETHVQSEDGRKCLKVAQKGLESVCDEDAQCLRSELGPLSRCNLDKKRCECSNNVMPIVYYKGICYFHRQLGSSCETNVECQAGSNYLAECFLRRCRCQNGTVRMSPHVCGFNSTASNLACKSVELSAYCATWYCGVIIIISSLIFDSFFRCSK